MAMIAPTHSAKVANPATSTTPAMPEAAPGRESLRGGRCADTMLAHLHPAFCREANPMLTAPIRCKSYCLPTFLVAALTIAHPAGAQNTVPPTAATPPVSMSQIQQVVTAYFGDQAKYRPGNLISQSDAGAILKKLGEIGWQPLDQDQILADALPDSHPLVSLARSKEGKKFMEKVSGFDLIYDRMDRLSNVSGGQRMLEALVRLPDGEKYAQPKKQLPNGVPDFLSLLPKNATGRVRTVKDYDKSTGRIYTEADLMRRLNRSWQGEVPPKSPT
ncbi:MAG: hypothetical protein ACYC4U_10195 [Pirellulaceae bacterium]